MKQFDLVLCGQCIKNIKEKTVSGFQHSFHSSIDYYLTVMSKCVQRVGSSTVKEGKTFSMSLTRSIIHSCLPLKHSLFI